MIELVVNTAGHTVAEHLLLVGGVPRPHLQGGGVVVLDSPWRRQFLIGLSSSLSTPELLLGSYEASVKNMR